MVALSVVICGVAMTASATDGDKNYYYLDSVNGDDANSGTDIDSPVKTLAGLKNLDIKAGTHFLFKNGVEYECTATLTCNGTEDNPVVISSYGDGEKAILYTNEKAEVLRLFDCSYVTVSDLHIKAPNGGGEFQFRNLFDSYIANNIIVPINGATIAYDIDESRGNVFENNCYYNVMTPFVDFGAMNTVPGFSGTDYSDVNSFRLSKDSPLIGAGSAVNGVEKDFYGNEITSNNIGCYGGTGSDTEYKGENFIEKIIRTVRNIFETLWHEIYVIFD